MVLQFSRPPARATDDRRPAKWREQQRGSRQQHRSAPGAHSQVSPQLRPQAARRPQARAHACGGAARARPVLPPGETVAEQAAALKEKLLTPEALEALWAEVESGEMGYMP